MAVCLLLRGGQSRKERQPSLLARPAVFSSEVGQLLSHAQEQRRASQMGAGSLGLGARALNGGH